MYPGARRSICFGNNSVMSSSSGYNLLWWADLKKTRVIALYTRYTSVTGYKIKTKWNWIIPLFSCTLSFFPIHHPHKQTVLLSPFLYVLTNAKPVQITIIQKANRYADLKWIRKLKEHEERGKTDLPQCRCLTKDWKTDIAELEIARLKQDDGTENISLELMYIYLYILLFSFFLSHSPTQTHSKFHCSLQLTISFFFLIFNLLISYNYPFFHIQQSFLACTFSNVFLFFFRTTSFFH